MSRIARVAAIGCFSALLLTFVMSAADAAPQRSRQAAPAPDERPRSAETRLAEFEFTIVPVTPSTQMDTDPFDFDAPYFHYELTNTGTSTDSYRLIIDNLSDPINFFPQVCIGFACSPDSAVHTMPAGADTLVGVQLFPLNNGMATADFHVYSVGEPANQAHFSVTIYAGTAAVGVDVLQEGATGYRLEQNSPNPVRSGTSIAFVLPESDRVTLAVYDVAGREVRRLTEASLPEGRHVFAWDGTAADGRDLTSGVYFYRLTTSRGSLSKSLTLIR
jgi:hypothetical protein